MKKDIFIDLDKQEVTKLSTGRICKKTLSITNKERDEKYFYIGFSFNGKSFNFRLHRLFFYWKYGYLPKIVDHIDTNSLNNDINNLREINDQGSSRNTKKMKNTKRKLTSKYKGVSKIKEKWRARIRNLNDKKDIWLGLFSSEDDAGQAYNDAIRKYGLEEVSVLNDTPQERARKINLFNEEKLSYS
jgi:FtsZ-binding cell division protein ZapB